MTTNKSTCQCGHARESRSFPSGYTLMNIKHTDFDTYKEFDEYCDLLDRQGIPYATFCDKLKGKFWVEE